MYPPPYAPQDTRSLATQVSSVMKRVYIKMTLGLLVIYINVGVTEL